ncbi:family 61 glycosyl hydrolase [Lasiosphaeris hirsuta]|uniref:lytic cellulose monooxygenase (C4-dehydrogenating) n=1 Tax=Lasiosphaeris hirsuta TaxID=260670 RepID=A0AA40ANK2_9PEZI|nr:family 61 glycosyl hydrolase [Lasiosphaeris hirsuta]
MAAAAAAHTIFQKVSVNGADQGQLKGMRAPGSNNPIQNVNDADFACNANLVHKDNTVITVPAGAKVGAWWGHEIGGASGPNDADNPIASSHKGPGPIIVYLARVDNAASTGTSGLKWFKVAESGLSNGVWAVDSMIANGGWHYFTLPSCVAAGQYLMRVELIALHSASTAGQAQFYMECAQIQVTGSGTNTGSATVSFPGAYTANNPGIQLSIYGPAGKPDNGGRAYPIPGPAVLTCSGSDNGTGGGGGGSKPQTTLTTTTTKAPAATGTPGGAALYAQCGGNGYSGTTSCASGTCKVINEYYNQCNP